MRINRYVPAVDRCAMNVDRFAAGIDRCAVGIDSSGIIQDLHEGDQKGSSPATSSSLDFSVFDP